MLRAAAAAIYARLREDGCGMREIVHVSSELIALVTASMHSDAAGAVEGGVAVATGSVVDPGAA